MALKSARSLWRGVDTGSLAIRLSTDVASNNEARHLPGQWAHCALELKTLITHDALALFQAQVV